MDLNKALHIIGNSSLIKGGKAAVIGEIRKFGGRDYIKTADGWKFHGKGTGVKAQAHKAGTSGEGKSTDKHSEGMKLIDSDPNQARHLLIDTKEKAQEFNEKLKAEEKRLGGNNVHETKTHLRATSNVLAAMFSADKGKKGPLTGKDLMKPQPGKLYEIDTRGIDHKEFVLEASDGSMQVDMTFSSVEEANKFAKKHGFPMKPNNTTNKVKEAAKVIDENRKNTNLSDYIKENAAKILKRNPKYIPQLNSLLTGSGFTASGESGKGFSIKDSTGKEVLTAKKLVDLTEQLRVQASTHIVDSTPIKKPERAPLKVESKTKVEKKPDYQSQLVPEKVLKQRVLARFGVDEDEVVKPGDHTHKAQYEPRFRDDEKGMSINFSTGNTKNWEQGGTWKEYRLAVSSSPYRGKYGVYAGITVQKNSYLNEIVSDKDLPIAKEYDTYEEARSAILKYFDIE